MKKLHKIEMFDAYDEGIQKLVADGHAELVPLELLDRSDGAVWYLPHYAVLSASKPGKLRIVFDCAAKYGGVSLNSECYRGPDLMNKLLHVLLRFRQYEYAVTADICAMYLQVRIPVADRDCLRFLWLKNDKVFHYRMTSHLFGGVSCASSSTYALRRTLDDFGATDLVRDAVCKSMYVDDLLRSLVSKDDISQLIRDVKMTLEKGGFSLTKFIVNDRHLLSEIPEEDRAQEVKVIKSEHNSKALGIRWDVNHDQFSYIRKEIDIDQVITKRHMLSLVATMYDPLGLVVPIIILGRMLFQQATKQKLTWDEPVPPDLFARWMSWWGSLCDLSSLVFKRCIVPRDYVDGAIELHHFCDGSQDAYGVCTYVRILSKSGSIHVQLLMAKARLTPVHPITILRTELCAAVMAVKVEEVLRNELELHLLPSTFWSDSQAVLYYIASDAHRFRVFVANRVSFIRSKTRVEQWHHVRSEHNSADILSRGCTPKTLPDIWKKGPDFLRRHRDSWPLECSVRQDLGSDDLEIKKSSCATSTVTVEMENPLDKLISYHSDYYRLRIAVAWLLRWLNMLRGTKNGEKFLMLGELRHAEDVLIKRVQFLNYADEIQSLQDGKPVKKSSHIASLGPILTDGARNTIHTIRRECMTCQKRYGVPRCQKMADLPEDRCSPATTAFTDGRSTVKRYGCIFTCLAVRAIHLEVLPSLETDVFINGFRMFCARRGHPLIIRSDNGTNLVGACTELADEMKRLDKTKIIATARRMDVEWIFNPPTASHYCGVWERMIRTIRRILLAVMPVTSITDDVLCTVLCEVENLVNSRPLTKCSTDICDDSPLTSNHFLLAECNYPIAWRKFSSGEVCRKRWKFVQNVVTSFWKRWIKEYLPNLQKRQKWPDRKPNYKIGDLVLVVDEVAPRGSWPLGMVTDVLMSRDGNVRSVRVKFRNTELVRPITKLIPLEMV